MISPWTSSSVRSRSRTTVSLGPDGIQAGLQGSQTPSVGGFDLLAQAFGFFIAPAQIFVEFALVAEIVSQGAKYIGQVKRVQTARDLLGRHPKSPILQERVQRNARLADAECARIVNAQ